MGSIGVGLGRTTLTSSLLHSRVHQSSRISARTKPAAENTKTKELEAKNEEDLIDLMKVNFKSVIFKTMPNIFKTKPQD